MLKIQLSNPKILYIKEEEDSSIEEAIETIFPRDTEYAFIIWDNLFIPLSYKYDISLMINDLIDIVEFINDSKKKDMTIYWTSNTFSSIWYLNKRGDSIEIQSQWNQVLGNLVESLNNNPKIVVESTGLRENVISLLTFIRESLNKCNYKDLKDYNRLENASIHL